MDYKVFGAGHSPSDEFVKELAAFCELDDVQREALAVWFETTSDFDTYTPGMPPGISASTLLPEQFRKAAAPIRFMLNAWQQNSLDIADIQRDLLLFGLGSKQIEVVTAFLQRLAPVRKRVWIDGLEGVAQVNGLPTIDDANVVWDARGVFGGPTYYHFSGDANEATYKQCFGLTCMAILELIVSDTGGVKERFAIQMNEPTFRQLLVAMNRADEQLKSLKALISPMIVANRNLES